MAGRHGMNHADRRVHAGDRAGGGGAPAARDVCVERVGRGSSSLTAWRLATPSRVVGSCGPSYRRGVRRLPPAARALRQGSGSRGAGGEPGADGRARSGGGGGAARRQDPGRRAAGGARAAGAGMEQRGARPAAGPLDARGPAGRPGDRRLARAGARRCSSRAADRWSLGPLTLPHELARVVVAEQLYRAWTILRGRAVSQGRKCERAMTEWFEEWFGEEYLQLYPHRDAAEAERAVALILDTRAVEPGWRVLDVACGAGRHARAFEAAGARCVGLDLSAALLRVARRRDRRAAGAGRHAGAADPPRIDGPHGEPVHQLRLLRARRRARGGAARDGRHGAARRMVRDRLPQRRRRCARGWCRARPGGWTGPRCRSRDRSRPTAATSARRSSRAGGRRFSERVRLFGAERDRGHAGRGGRHRSPALRRLRRLAAGSPTRRARFCSGRRHEPALRPTPLEHPLEPPAPREAARRRAGRGVRAVAQPGTPQLARLARARAPWRSPPGSSRALHRAALHHPQGAQRRGAGAACSSGAGSGRSCRCSGWPATTTTSPRRARRPGSRPTGRRPRPLSRRGQPKRRSRRCTASPSARRPCRRSSSSPPACRPPSSATRPSAGSSATTARRHRRRRLRRRDGGAARSARRAAASTAPIRRPSGPRRRIWCARCARPAHSTTTSTAGPRRRARRPGPRASPVGDGAALVMVEASLGRDRLVPDGDAFVTRRSRERFDLAAHRAASPPTSRAALAQRAAAAGGRERDPADGGLSRRARRAPVSRAHPAGVRAARHPAPAPAAAVVGRHRGAPGGPGAGEVRRRARPTARAAGRARGPAGARPAAGRGGRGARRGCARPRRRVWRTRSARRPRSIRRWPGPRRRPDSRRSAARRTSRRSWCSTSSGGRRPSSASSAAARTAVFPNGKPQERVLTVAPFLARYGPGLLAELTRQLRGMVPRRP